MERRPTFRRIAFVLPLGLGLLSACQSLPLEQPLPSTPKPEPPAQEAARPPEAGPDSGIALIPDSTERSVRQEILEIGTGEYTAIPAEEPAAPVTTADGDITLNFQDVDLREFVKVVLGDLLGKNFAIDPGVGGRVTIQSGRPVSRAALLPLVEEVLSINNAALVESGDLLEILPRQQAPRGNVAPSVIERKSGGGYTVRIIPLRHIAAQEMQKILEPLIPEGNDLRIDKKRNLVIASGSASEIDVIQETIDIFDVDWLRGMSVGLYPLDYVDAKTLKDELDAIIGAVEGEDSKELLGGLVRSVAIERLGSILLIGSTAAALREAEIWVRRLDQPGLDMEKRLYVYNVRNAKAMDIADILGQVFRGAGARGPGASGVVLAPGLEPVQITTEAEQRQSETEAERPTAMPSSPEAGVGISGRDSIEIIADDVRNALVVLATPQEYKMVEAAIGRLDVVPLQVLIEASIIEVTLRDDLSYGVEWFFKNHLQDDKTGRGTLDLGAAGLAALSPSFAYTIVNSADQVRVALNALAEESEINVLSSPSLMVLDNQAAMINVGDEIPIPVRQSTSNIDPAAPTVNEIEFRKTGVTLNVTPRVGSSGLVTMQIRQEVSNAVSTTTSEIDAPTIQQRQIESVVAINSGETIILGGLIQSTETNSEGGIPVLHKIPLIGNLFGQTRDEARRTELLVILTPRVVRNRDDARGITEEFRRKLEGIAAPGPS